MTDPVDDIPKMLLPEMREFVGLLCSSFGVKGDKAPAQGVVAMPKTDILQLVAVRNFLDKIEPYADQIRKIVVTKGGAIR